MSELVQYSAPHDADDFTEASLADFLLDIAIAVAHRDRLNLPDLLALVAIEALARLSVAADTDPRAVLLTMEEAVPRRASILEAFSQQGGELPALELDALPHMRGGQPSLKTH